MNKNNFLFLILFLSLISLPFVYSAPVTDAWSFNFALSQGNDPHCRGNSFVVNKPEIKIISINTSTFTSGVESAYIFVNSSLTYTYVSNTLSGTTFIFNNESLYSGTTYRLVIGNPNTLDLKESSSPSYPYGGTNINLTNRAIKISPTGGLCDGGSWQFDTTNAGSEWWTMQSSEVIAPPATVVNFTLINQSPANITSTTIFSENVIITYNITMPNFNKTTFLNYSIIFGTNTTIQTYTNGTITSSGYRTDGVLISNSSNQTYSYTLGENSVYPSINNLASSYFNTSHSVLTLTGINDFAKIGFLNLSNVSSAGFLEVMANRTTTGGTAGVWFCNSSYTTGLVTNSVNCVQISSNELKYNHSHGIYSSHVLIPFTITNGRLNGVAVSTGYNYFLIRDDNPGDTNVYYVPNVTQSEASRSTNNGGNTWTDISGTIDAHIHQYFGNDFFTYQACGYNTTGSKVCSTFTSELIDITPLNPSGVSFLNPNTSLNITRFINISWNPATGFNGQNIILYNLTLRIVNESFYYQLVDNKGINTSFYWDTYLLNNTPRGFYEFEIETTQQDGLKSITTSSVVEVLTNAQLNISLNNAFTGTNLNNFYGWIYNNETGYNQTFTTLTNVSELNVQKGMNILNIYKANYSISEANQILINVSETFQKYNATLYSANSVLINIYDENTGTRITGQNITVIISGLTEYTYSTTSGVLFVENLTDGSYTVKLSGGNYSLKQYPITVASSSTQTLNAFLTTSTSTVVFTVQDFDSGAVIEGASFIMQRLINSTWVTVESKSTDITGQAEFTYNIAVKYKFIVQVSGYTNKIFYLDPVLSPTYTVRMIKTTTLTSSPDYTGVGIVLTPGIYYKDRQNNVSFTFTSPEGVLTSYFLNVSWPGGSNNYSGVNAIGGTFSFPINITGVTDINSRVTFIYGYDSTIDNPKFYRQDFEIIGAITTGPVMQNNTFLTNKDKTYGLGLLDRLIIVVGLVIVITGFISMAVGAPFGIAIGLVFMAYMVMIGFIPIWSIIISVFVGFMLLVKWGG